MAKTCAVAALIATIFCFSPLLNLAQATSETFFVEGKVYCDTCRVQFETKISQPLADSKVRLECRKREGGELTYSFDGTTNSTGIYRLPVDGDHEEEICEVVALKSSRADCSDLMAGYERARITLTNKNGLASIARYPNPLGFMVKEALPSCLEILAEMGLIPLDL
ncbi:olee1-like protein [Quercus suber]|uniref:olee1-like protein n=1 Tax=Quercus suber TaxID=58331 RepID=UPI000CE26AC3|nr:olee1-like protein [Quercus suber]POE68236.1 olee1-like protein [Quercus suber]